MEQERAYSRNKKIRLAIAPASELSGKLVSSISHVDLTLQTFLKGSNAVMMINLKHAQSGVLRSAKVGFSWTTLLFGFFPALFRGDIKWAAIMCIIGIITFGFSWLIFPFFYNKVYIKGLLEKGYVPADDMSRNMLIKRGIYTDPAPVTTDQS